ncbi:xylulokinase [Alicyclobacillus fastidiosus]|uniref:Xylulose kinase n=1 Tax=Alicyclobacillus fastidiosus TaxID=392011 RepID=A0ABY6ZJG6_9BACL|nr:xylulokinase [Alicyclobacillus fastidiosus]WAH43014.1 xylulokinase [Alicyclobacillus fastidiosus]
MSRLEVVLGIDVGTSGTKAIAVDALGQVQASASSNYEMDVPKVGYAEQHPDLWWGAAVESVKSVVGLLKGKGYDVAVQSISFSGQMHGLVALDDDGHPLRPSIIWCDVRTTAEADWLERALSREQIIEWTNNPPLPNFTATKLLWVKEHEREVYGRIRQVMLPKDYVRFRMTGRYHAEVTDASGTLLFDVSRRQWSQPMCDALGIPQSWLPEMVEASTVTGELTAEAARLMGLQPGIPVVAGAGDQAAGALGVGVRRQGQVSMVLGTSGVVLTPTASPVVDASGALHSFCHALPNTWFMMGVTQAAGGSLEWYRETFEATGVSTGGREDTFEALLGGASQVVPGSEGLIFLPYLMGERTPILDPLARGAWLGLSRRHRQAHLVRALLEGVSLSLTDCWNAMEKQGVKAAEWLISGGGANSRLWVEILSACVKRPLQVVQARYGPALGAAMIAADGVGFGARRDGVLDWVQKGDDIAGPTDWQASYERLYSLYQTAYVQLKDVFHALADES